MRKMATKPKPTESARFQLKVIRAKVQGTAHEDMGESATHQSRTNKERCKALPMKTWGKVPSTKVELNKERCKALKKVPRTNLVML
jgi:hypothetical protein